MRKTVLCLLLLTCEAVSGQTIVTPIVPICQDGQLVGVQGFAPIPGPFRITLWSGNPCAAADPKAPAPSEPKKSVRREA